MLIVSPRAGPYTTLVNEMAASRVLRSVDALALGQLCEDQAMLDTLRKGMAEMTREIAVKRRKRSWTFQADR